MDRHKQLAKAKRLAKSRAKLIEPDGSQLSVEQRSIAFLAYKWAGRFTGVSLPRWLSKIRTAEDREAECKKWSAIALSVREYIARKKPQPVEEAMLVRVVSRLAKFADGDMQFDKSIGLTRDDSQLVHTCWFAVLAHSDGSVSLKQFEKS